MTRPEGGKPRGPLAHDGRHRREALRVVDGRRLAVQAGGGRERRLEARLAGLALERLEQAHLLAADVGAGADEGVQIEVDARTEDVAAEQAGRVGLLHGGLETRYRLAEKFPADVVVADARPHGVAADCHALDDRVRVVAQDVAVVTGARLALVGIADDVLLARRITRHEAPLESRRKTGAAAAAQAGCLHRLDDGQARRPLAQDLLPGLVAADAAIDLERPRALVLERFEHDEILFVSHACLTSGGRESRRSLPASDSRSTGDRPSSSARRCRQRDTRARP